MLTTWRSDYVARKFFVLWVQLFGAPGHICHDQGGEFELSFTQLLEQMAAPSTVTGSHAGWQLAVGERHGGILGTMVGAITTEHVTEGFHGMKLALSSALAAKNIPLPVMALAPTKGCLERRSVIPVFWKTMSSLALQRAWTPRLSFARFQDETSYFEKARCGY